ncbi:endo-1,4-beta-xylanase [Thermobifida fusca TM51]|uniref:Beta-xylanase n=1 Tax=Thermobifida fusca TM51 TaxID=1169414 RepID=A0A9P2WPQ7_THEFU|nr:endo-1,4-beta-xylanase [Thermobifida fusca]EOR70126.1 endo-1,4-beta-xylanase [Thermobifida fusca TM51]
MKPVRLITAALTTAVLSLPLMVVPASAGPVHDHHPAPHSNAKSERLRWAAPDGFYIGSAVAGGGHHLEQDYPDPFTHDGKYRSILAQQFSSVSPENQMKWEYIHPEPDRYDFAMADKIVDFAERNDQKVRGHTLLWHSQNPEWLEEGDYSPEELREILRDHITTVVGRYAGRIHQWDVANEIFDEQGNLRTQENIWIRELGPGIIADAFRWAHEADPNAELFFNDYNVEGINPKSDAYYELIQELLDDGVPVHGFSVQGHLSTRYDFPGDLEQNLRRFDELGLATAITELDVRMDLPASGKPTPKQLEQQADYYQQALEACLAVEGCDSFTIWGFTDKYSWVPVFFPDEGAATIMTEKYERKPAFFALQQTLREARCADSPKPGPGKPKPGKGPKHDHC